MNSLKKNSNLNIILGEGGVGGARFSKFFYTESKPKMKYFWEEGGGGGGGSECGYGK